MMSSESSTVRLGLLVIAITGVALLAWSGLAPLNGAIVAGGLVKTEHNRKLVQHTDGGIVKKVFVSDGDIVLEGQPLLELDDVKIDANLQLLSELMIHERIKNQRLDAEQQLASSFRLNTDFTRNVPAALLETAYQRELKIFRARRTLLDEQVLSYRKQLEAIAVEQVALREQARASREGASLARDELRLNEGLLKEKFISRARLISLQRAVAEYGAKQGEHEAALAQSEERKHDLSLRMSSAQAAYQKTAAEEFKDSDARLTQLREQLRPAQDSADRKLIVSPAAGRVVGLRVNAPGEVAPPREPLMEIVPNAEGLIVEARVGVDAIRHLQQGQETELRFTTFNSRTTPLVKGNLIYISADAMVDKNGVPSYQIQVRPKSESLAASGIKGLQPGMAAEVYILLEARTIFNYLMAPISETLLKTMREP